MNYVFGMITTSKSHEYTAYAMESFFNYTPLHQDDRVYVIDNDNDCDLEFNNSVYRIKNPEPKSFAENANRILQQAKDYNRTAVILNNDVIFTPGWFPPLLVTNVVTVPFSNQFMPYRTQGLNLTPCMQLKDFNFKYAELNQMAWNHRVFHPGGLVESDFIPFYTVRIPFSVICSVGLFDTNFGKGGGEDIDYRLRCIRKGINVKLANDSYILHFGGKSSWDGAESPKEISERDQVYRAHFEKKWGHNLASLFMYYPDRDEIIERYDLYDDLANHNYKKILDTIPQ